MKAAVIHCFDSPPRFDSFAEPVAQENEKLVRVRAAALHPIVRNMANGTHYGSYPQLPAVAGLDGAGRLEDGSRVYFGTLRRPFASMAQMAVALKSFCIPIPDAIPDELAAAIVNPAMSSWLALQLRGRMVEGETVLIMGATGAAGRLAVPISKLLGAKRVIAAGRNREVLEQTLHEGADEIIPLDQPEQALDAAFRSTAEGGIDIVLDYAWGRPAECLMQALTTKGMRHIARRVRFVQIGDTAGKTITLAGTSLRSSAIELIGSGAGSVALERVSGELTALLEAIAKHNLRLEIDAAPLSEVETAWNAPRGRKRLVLQI